MSPFARSNPLGVGIDQAAEIADAPDIGWQIDLVEAEVAAEVSTSGTAPADFRRIPSGVIERGGADGRKKLRLG